MSNLQEFTATKVEQKQTMIRCLAIDDDPLFLKMIKVLFTDIKSAVLVDSYTNSVEGIMAIVKQKPDVILLDIEMPYLNGLEALETLDKKPKVIIISGHLTNPKDLGVTVDRFISKSEVKSSVMLEAAINSVI